ncbi:YkvI family membrane protein [Novosphingobium aquimarinum]|uniref:YkvI family membrane protein n=1 Tax=Novosphingobium aquimarinum TaxID=2682494 RepID=UPI0012EC5F98|nr:hypothetical protein [Novosphingobium aquimarinum]
MSVAADRFRRFLLPGLAFKAVVIGGGYATGRELAEFFLPHGPWGGVAAMGLATLIWSLVAAATFAVAFRTGARDYRHFFQELLGRSWFLFEIAYAVFIVLILAVFGAAAGEIAKATLGLPGIAGTLALMAAIVACVAFGNDSVERVFMVLSVLLYLTYAIFLALSLAGVGGRIADTFAAAAPPGAGWSLGALAYASYNIVGAVVILPITRHFRSQRDAVRAGLIAGPLAMLPALLFFVSMVAFLPEVTAAVLPSDFILGRLGHPAFNALFQLMIFAALLESGIGAVHAVNERIAKTRGIEITAAVRAALAFALLLPCMLVADGIGLVALIASGYRVLAWIFIAVYIIPLLAYVLLRRGGSGPILQSEP